MILDDIRAAADARFASGEFIPRLMEAAYQHRLRFEMKHLWQAGDDFKGADEYRLYVREKIKLAQRRRYWEDMGCFYHHSGNVQECDNVSDILADIGVAEKKLAQKRLDIRERIGEITYV